MRHCGKMELLTGQERLHADSRMTASDLRFCLEFVSMHKKFLPPFHGTPPPLNVAWSCECESEFVCVV